MRNNKGFTLMEVLLTTTLFLSMLFTISPISIQIYKERQILNEEHFIMHTLYNELRTTVLTNTFTDSKTTHHSFRNTNFSIYYQQEELLIKGCASWNNSRNITKEVCFYAYP